MEECFEIDEAVGGVPAKILNPSEESSFTSYAFSSDGSRMATGESKGTIKLWSTIDYALLAQVSALFESHVFPMIFKARSCDVLIAVDDSSNLLEFGFPPMDEMIIMGPTMIQPEVLRSIQLTDQPLMWCHLSSDGRTVVYAIKEMTNMITICRLHDSSCQRHNLKFDSVSNRFPVVSQNGYGLLVCDMEYGVHHTEPRVSVWMGLDKFDSIKHPAVLEGHRAMWGLEGAYLVLFWGTSISGPGLSIFETKTLKPGKKNRSWRERRFSTGVSNFKAQMLPGHLGGHIKVLVCEIGKSGVRRCLIWDLEDDVIHQEVVLSMEKQRMENFVRVASGPRIFQQEGYNRVTATLSIEVEWEQMDKTVLLALLEEDVHPKYCLSKNEEWIGVFSWRTHSCAIASVVSGATVWSFCFPPEVSMDPSVMHNQVRFDPTGSRFLIFGDKAIYVCAPPFLKSTVAPQMSTTPRLYALFPNAGISKLVSEVASKADGALLAEELMMRLHRRQSPTLNTDTDLTATTSALLQIVTDKPLLPLARSVSDAEDGGIPEIDRETLLSTVDSSESHLSSINGMTRVIISEDDRTGYSLFFSLRGKFVTCSSDGSIRQLKPKPRCFNLSPMQNRSRVVMLATDNVNIVDMFSGTTVETIEYLIDFELLVPLIEASTKWKRDHRWTGTHYTGRCLSDDGRRILLGWDTRNGRSITVNPSTERIECAERITMCHGSLSDYCCLSCDGDATAFVDVDDLHEGNLTVGVFCEKSKTCFDPPMLNYIACLAECIVARFHVCTGIETQDMHHEDLRSLLSCLFFEVATDTAALITFLVPKNDAVSRRCCLKEQMCIFSCSSQAQYCPDYKRLMDTANDGTMVINRVLQAFGFCGAFNMPHTKGRSIFQEAILNNNVQMVDSMVALAKKHDHVFGLNWTPQGCPPRSLFYEVMERKSSNEIRSMMTLIGTGSVPFDRAARDIGSHYRTLLFDYPEVIESALSKDDFVIEICQLKVHPDYLNPTIRRDSAIHIHSTDSVTEWRLDGDPEQAGQRWKHQHADEVRLMEKKGNKPTVMAKLKAICIENAAGIGGKGIIRSLLMNSVPEHIFKHTVVKWVVLYKWSKIWRKRFAKILMKYAVFLILFTVLAIRVGSSTDISEETEKWKMTTTCLLIVVFIFGCMMVLEEIRKITSFIRDGQKNNESLWWSLKYFFHSIWKWVDIISCGFLVGWIPISYILCLFYDGYEDWLTASVALESLVASIKVWYFAQPFKDSGALVLMIKNVVKDCFVFLMLAFFILFGFALALHVLFRAVDETDIEAGGFHVAFKTFQFSLLTMFYAMVGTFEPEIFTCAHHLAWLMNVVFSLFMIAQMIVLLNLLIAIMGDTFDRVKSMEEAQMLKACASFIDACEAGLTKLEAERIEKEIGRYIQVLVGLNDDDELDEDYYWLGRMQMLKKSFRRHFNQSEKLMKNMVDEMRSKVTEETTGLRMRVERMESKIETMHAETTHRLDDLLFLLRK